MSLDGFVPLALQPDWVLEREFGWSVRAASEDFKLLARRRGPLTTFLVLTRGAPLDEVAGDCRRHGALHPLALATWVDLAPAQGEAASVREAGGVLWRRAAADRFFGAGTFVVDLREPEDDLWARVSSGKRKELRQVERAGARAVCAPARRADLADFLGLHARLARRKRLPPAPAEVLERLMARGALVACRALDPSGVPRVVNLLYVAHGQGYFLYGAGDDALPPGLGLLAQWEGVRALRALGLRHYDLGLVASRDESDGVYRFKRSLGGEFVAYGEEYRHAPAWLRLALDWRERARRA